MFVDCSFSITLHTIANAETEAVSVLVKLGDANNDGTVTLADATYIQSYLQGQVAPSSDIQFTAMDYNQDKIVDNYDADQIMHDWTYACIHDPVYKTPYTRPKNESMTYLEHTCSLNNTWSATSYSLTSVPLSPVLSSINELSEPIRYESVDNENVPCVYLAVKKADNTMDYVSGVVVGNHTIATAAHNLYDNGYAKKVSIEVLNKYCSETLLSCEAISVHIPQAYLTSSIPENYDYGLIYTTANLYNYKANIGVMSDTFLNSSNNLVTSGFTLQYGVRRRFKSNGNTVSMSGIPSQVDYRFHSEGTCSEGKQGGMVYYETTSDINTFVGIGTNPNYSNMTDTYGIRITPTLMKFFYQNSHVS